MREGTIGAALRIFADSGLAELRDDEDGPSVRLLPVSERVDMESNERFAEGEANREAFATFSELALYAPAQTLERLLNRPIYPSDVKLRK